jgi:hypothetical protein
MFADAWQNLTTRCRAAGRGCALAATFSLVLFVGQLVQLGEFGDENQRSDRPDTSHAL